MDLKLVEIKCQGSMELPLGDLKPFQGNLKDLSQENYTKLKNEILRHGFSEPVSVWKNEGSWYILNGHQRIRALQAMESEGYKVPKVPVSIVHAKDIKDAKERVLALTSQFGQITDEGLYEFMNDSGLDIDYLDGLRFPEVDLDKWKDNFLEELSGNGGAEDDVPDVPVEPISKLGDLYELGNHRLLCGDSTSIDAVEKLMDGEKADMVFTDPPYGINYDDSRYLNTGKVNNFGKIKGDKSQFNVEFILQYFLSTKEIFIFGGNNFPELTKPHGSFICWDKKLESQAGLLSGDFELCWSKVNHGMKMLRKMWCGYQSKEKGEVRHHPTQKPIDLIEQFFRNWGHGLTNIVDLFGGSGSTLIACEKTNRKCFMMELDPGYIDVIVSRFCKYTGQTKIKRNDEEIEWVTPTA